MRELLWKILEESKEGKAYLASKQQHQNLTEILKGYDKETLSKLKQEWDKVGSEIGSKKIDESKPLSFDNREFEQLHVEDGGIVNGGDDTFYTDFGSWLVAQGETLFNDFQERGHIAVVDYIHKHQIPEEDYTFEPMSYFFREENTI